VGKFITLLLGSLVGRRDDVGLQVFTLRALMAAKRHAPETRVTLNSKHSHGGSALITNARTPGDANFLWYLHTSNLSVIFICQVLFPCKNTLYILITLLLIEANDFHL
jgi:hypothetical protein